jgi:integrase
MPSASDNQMLSACTENCPITTQMYTTAIRRAELLNLSLLDIEGFRRQLVMIWQGKGKRDRVVPIGIRALEWMEKYIADVRSWLAAGNETRHRRPAPQPTDKVLLGDAERSDGSKPNLDTDCVKSEIFKGLKEG